MSSVHVAGFYIDPSDAKAVKRLAACAALVLALCSGFLAYRAAAFEMSGEAIYGGKWGRRVTRESEPEAFREATNGYWAFSGILACFAGGFFVLYRKLDGWV